MKRLFTLALLLILAACDQAPPQPPNRDIDDLRGQWVVINYWAKWCKPCIREIPELNTLDQMFPEVTVLGVNYDGATGEELAAQIAQLGIEFSVLPEDPAGTIGTQRPVVLPTTLILAPTGELSQTLIGPQTLASLAEATGQSAPTPQD